MTVFRILSLVVIGAFLVGIVLYLRRQAGGWQNSGRVAAGYARIAARLLRGRNSPGRWSTLDNLRRLAYRGSAVLFVLLALTGFFPVLILGEPLSGLLLVVHVTLAPLFALFLTALALLWAHRLRLDDADWRYVLVPGGRGKTSREERIRLGFKVGFWIILVLSLPLMGSIIAGLYPLFGPEGGALLTRVHGYSALLLLVVVLTEMYLTILLVQRAPMDSTTEHAP